MRAQLISIRSISYFFITRHQLFITTDLLPVFSCNPKHTKTFTLVSVKMFMMHFMCPTDRTYISAVASCEPFETLMNDHIMYNKIRKAISHDPKTDRLHPPYMIISAEIDQQHAWNCENDKEGIVLFKKTRFFLVMITMKCPQKSMHHKSMSKPGHTFHDNER